MITRSIVRGPWYATQEEMAELSENLKRAHLALLNAVEGFPSPDWECAGTHGGWSAGQIAEHIFLSQRVLREQIHSHLQDQVCPELPPMMEQQRAKLIRYLPGGGKAEAGKQSTAFHGLKPEHLAGEIFQAEKQFLDLLGAAAACPIKAIGWNSPFFGELSAFLWLHYPALHTTRHVAQLLRLRSSLDN